jgi:dihydroorotase
MFASAIRFSLVSTMTSMLALGLTLEQVIPMVTTHAAQLAGMAGTLGHLGAGAVADVTVLADERGKWTLRDNEHNQVVAQRMLRPRFCLRAGTRYDAEAAILPSAKAA